MYGGGDNDDVYDDDHDRSRMKASVHPRAISRDWCNQSDDPGDLDADDDEEEEVDDGVDADDDEEQA